MYQPLVFKLNSAKYDILNNSFKSTDIKLSSTINIPLISLGFHNFMHRTKNSMSITSKLSTTNKFYYVVNPFEPIISNYDESLNNLTKQYLSIKEDMPEITSRSFYKMWEIIYLFNLVDKPELTCATLAESTNAFIQAIINFREKLGLGISKDKIFQVAIATQRKGKHVENSKQFLGWIEKTRPGLINRYKTISHKKALNHKSKSSSDITQVKTISLFKKDIEKSKSYADLVIANGSFEWEDKNYQEQEAYQLILGEIIAALRVQAESGHFVLRMFETFTIMSIKLIYLLSSFYEETFIHKPFYSRISSSEKYIICKNFKYNPKKDSSELDKKIKSLEKVLEAMTSNKFTYDIYPDLEFPSGYLTKFKFINTKIANPQQIMINEIVKYIKDNNYFGDNYHMFKEKQIEATKWWVSNFYPPSNNLYQKNKEDLQQLLKSSQEKNEMEETKFINTLVK